MVVPDCPLGLQNQQGSLTQTGGSRTTFSMSAGLLTRLEMFQGQGHSVPAPNMELTHSQSPRKFGPDTHSQKRKPSIERPKVQEPGEAELNLCRQPC
jgi:hypothetical protein